MYCLFYCCPPLSDPGLLLHVFSSITSLSYSILFYSLVGARIETSSSAFFLFNHTRILLTYLDYRGTLFYPDPVCRPAPKVGLDSSPRPPPTTDYAR